MTAGAPGSPPPGRSSGIRVLLAEDELNLGMILQQFLSARGCDVTVVRNGRSALELLLNETFDVALVDIVMPEMDGLEVLQRVREHPMPPEVIVITGNGTMETAITALKLGAYDFLAKPYRMAEIEVLVRRAWEKRMLTRDNAVLHSQLKRATEPSPFLTQYAPLIAVMSLVERVAPSGSPVLITGASGTGKDVVARLLHLRSGQPDGPFVALNCAALLETMLESELFGVERGVFPGAAHRKTGLLELAAGGTLYLDNVGGLNSKLQGKLLRALESGSFHRVGGTQKIQVQVRVVASSTEDLTRMAASGAFRADLLHHINTIRVVLPTLRERAVDVPLLAQHFIGEFGRATPPVLSSDALSALERYRWPGNVRELRNVIERAVLLAASGHIGARDLPLASETGAGARATPASSMTLAELERRHVGDMLERAAWHQGRAAEFLGISPKTLYRKIREFGLHRPQGRGA